MAGGDDDAREARLQLESVGLAIVAVAVSTGVTVGVGISAPIWARAVAALGTVALLLVALRAGSSRGRGLLTRLARWIVRG